MASAVAINNGVWMQFNDHTVKEVSSAAVTECKLYILFYLKRDTTSAGRLSTSTGGITAAANVS